MATVDEAVTTYNYANFSRSESTGKPQEFKERLRVGEEAPDFELPTLEGERIRLSQFRGQRHVLLEFGSITGPSFVGEVSPLNELYHRYQDKGFEFFTVYVRETHPGENYGPHRSWEQKLQHAQACRTQDGIEVPLLVDELEGTVHRLYGTMPNTVYIIDKEGRVAYKAMWTDHAEIEVVLENLVMADQRRAQGVRLKPSYSEKINYIPSDSDDKLREQMVFDRAGPQANEDLKRMLNSRT